MNLKEYLGVFENIFWLSADKLSKILIGVTVVVAVARYMEPSGFGVFSYAQAIVAIFLLVSTLGFDTVVVRDLIKYRKSEGEILGSALFIRFCASVVIYLTLCLFIYNFRSESDLLLWSVLILGINVIGQPFKVFSYWFEARLKLKYVVWITNTNLIVFSALKIFVIYLDFGFYLIVWLTMLELLLSNLFIYLAYIYISKDTISLSIKTNRIKELLRDSWPLIISSAVWVLYTRVDQLMVGRVLGEEAVGIYSAAVKISDIVSYLPSVIVVSLIPKILPYKKSNPQGYEEMFQGLYNLVLSLLIPIALFLSLFSEVIIKAIFGEIYLQSADVLRVNAWMSIFFGMAVISGRYLLNENKQRLSMIRHIFGLVVNVVLNYFLIKLYGMIGAAYASLISLFLANYIFDVFFKDTRKVFKQKTIALTFIWVFSLFKSRGEYGS